MLFIWIFQSVTISFGLKLVLKNVFIVILLIYTLCCTYHDICSNQYISYIYAYNMTIFMEYFHTVPYTLYVLDNIGKPFMKDKEFTITGAGLLDSFTTPRVKHIGVRVSNNANLYKVRIRKRTVTAETLSGKPSLDNTFWVSYELSGVVFWWFCSDFQRESDAEKGRAYNLQHDQILGILKCFFLGTIESRIGMRVIWFVYAL